jgi:hypothetical protein
VKKKLPSNLCVWPINLHIRNWLVVKVALSPA